MGSSTWGYIWMAANSLRAKGEASTSSKKARANTEGTVMLNIEPMSKKALRIVRSAGEQRF